MLAFAFAVAFTAPAPVWSPRAAPASRARMITTPKQPPSPPFASSLQILAAQALAMLGSSDEEAEALRQHAQDNREVVRSVAARFDVRHDGQLRAAEAEKLFTALAFEMLHTAAADGKGAAAAHARELLAARRSDASDSGKRRLSATVSEISSHLLRLADKDADGIVSLDELAELFTCGLHAAEEAEGGAMEGLRRAPGALDLYELRGSLQLLPRIARHYEGTSLEAAEWHDKVPGDSHTLLRWVAPTHARDGLSIVGLGRSADASCYYLPEWGLVLDAGLAIKAFTPKTVLLSHGHRDHVQALPVLSQPAQFKGTKGTRPPAPKVLLPAALEPLVRNFLHSDAVLNFGRAQTLEETYAALGSPDLHPCRGGDVVELPPHCFSGKEGLCVEVFDAVHKGMPAVSYGIFRKKRKLKPEYAEQRHRIGDLLKEQPDLEVTMTVREHLLFYSGDTTIGLLEKYGDDVLRYQYIIHECTFCGPPSEELNQHAEERGHTHYAELHKFICSAPNTIFVLVHWSLKYSREDVENFFEDQYGGVPRNVVLWI